MAGTGGGREAVERGRERTFNIHASFMLLINYFTLNWRTH